jgi:hypothetical protein
MDRENLNKVLELSRKTGRRLQVVRYDMWRFGGSSSQMGDEA